MWSACNQRRLCSGVGLLLLALWGPPVWRPRKLTFVVVFSSQGPYDQFAANNVQSTYDEALYTTKLDMSALSR